MEVGFKFVEKKGRRGEEVHLMRREKRKGNLQEQAAGDVVDLELNTPSELLETRRRRQSFAETGSSVLILGSSPDIELFQRRSVG
jgi:hypothetical protein